MTKRKIKPIKILKNKPSIENWVKSVQGRCPHITWITENKISHPYCLISEGERCTFKKCKRIPS